MFRLMLTFALYFLAQPVLATSSALSNADTGVEAVDLSNRDMSLSAKGRTTAFRTAIDGHPVTQALENRESNTNPDSDVFGANLFRGSFIRNGGLQHNADHIIATGDRIQFHFWGDYEFDGVLTVDPKGNVYLPRIGPVKLQGIRTEKLQTIVQKVVREKIRSRVSCYISLASTQPLRVFVGGFVPKPGLYAGTSTDSLLHYLDLAGGIDPERGSFHGIQVKKGDAIRTSVSLYDFLLNGRVPLVELSDGDVIFVPPRQNTIKVTGLAENANRFEFGNGHHTVASISWLARPKAEATHVRVVRNAGSTRNVEYHSLESGSQVVLNNGDEIEFVAEKRPGTIAVRVEGEQLGSREYVLPYGARLGELLRNARYSNTSEPRDIQLYRKSVREHQRQMLSASSDRLRAALFNAESGTSKDSDLPKEDARLLLEWVTKANDIEPKGQITVAQTAKRDELLLEDGDVIRIPKRDGLVLVSGEVFSPSAIAFDPKMNLMDYVHSAGGFSRNANTEHIVVAHRDGSVEDTRLRETSFFGRSKPQLEVREGDQIIVLPNVRTKSLDISGEISELIYQIAILKK